MSKSPSGSGFSQETVIESPSRSASTSIAVEGNLVLHRNQFHSPVDSEL